MLPNVGVVANWSELFQMLKWVMHFATEKSFGQ